MRTRVRRVRVFARDDSRSAAPGGVAGGARRRMDSDRLMAAIALVCAALWAPHSAKATVSEQQQQPYLLNVGAKPPYTQSELPAGVAQGRVVLLTTWFGQMPCIGCAGHYAGTDKWCNGGIPQLANTTAHVAAMEKEMDTSIPDKDFDGFIVQCATAPVTFLFVLRRVRRFC
eukprot:COSAG02_NODE_169_length_31557_cov_25.092473_8_plen_172_part_00